MNKAVINQRLHAELPFMATENILMVAVRGGGDRQDLHERIRKHSQEAAKQVKQEGKPNDLMTRLKSDDAFAQTDLTLRSIRCFTWAAACSRSMSL